MNPKDRVPPDQFVLTQPNGRESETWTYAIGPFTTREAAEKHAKKFRIRKYDIKRLIHP